jgi:PBP1b-binding outer membrane lipoprotein LpoB
MKRILALAILALCVTGCTDFERSTFQTLSASKAVIDTAQADYEARTIPHNTCSYTIINDAKAVQISAVNSMVVYENEKAAKVDLTAQTQVVTDTLLKLPPVIAQVKTLYSNPNCGGSK